MENEINEIRNAITNYRPFNFKGAEAVSNLRERITTALLGFKEILGTETDVSRAREALAKHLGKLVLTPAMRDGRPLYTVEGSVSVLGGTERCRMQLVARDGIEPPTPAFSGLRSTN